ncbi:MAG: hypothetical protein EOP93_23980 [Lysobacteraceae bacterium]|nr:MAG: hypothetical protein EOP93_23980 [Xanthomonadaceae bacterium]
MITIIGYVGAAGAATMWLPQAARAIRHRHHAAALASISLSTYSMAVLFNALLLAYGVLRDAQPVVVAGAVNLACALVIVTVLAACRRTS